MTENNIGFGIFCFGEDYYYKGAYDKINKILESGYNCYVLTENPDHFFNQLMKFDELWTPAQWQFDCLVEQGCPPEKIHVIPEGVDVDTFKPIEKYSPKEKFRFLHFGRWDYRKGTTEILRAFSEEFADDENVIPEGYQFYTCSDVTKFMPFWRPKYTLEEGIKKYKKYLDDSTSYR